MQASCSVDVRGRLPNSCCGMGQWCGSHLSFNRAGKGRQNISRLALEGFQDSFALTSSARNRGRHSGNHIPVERPRLYHLSFTACLSSFPLSSPLPDTYTHLPAIAEEVSTYLLQHNQKCLGSKQQLVEEILRVILHGKLGYVIVAAPSAIKNNRDFRI